MYFFSSQGFRTGTPGNRICTLTQVAIEIEKKSRGTFPAL